MLWIRLFLGGAFGGVIQRVGGILTKRRRHGDGSGASKSYEGVCLKLLVNDVLVRSWTVVEIFVQERGKVRNNGLLFWWP